MRNLWQQFTSILSWLAIALWTLGLTLSSTFFWLVEWTGRWAHIHHRFWARGVLFFVRAKVSMRGKDRIDRGKAYVLASNHEGSVEIPIFIAHLPLQFKFAAKRTLFRIPCLGWAMSAARYVPIDRGEGLHKAKEAIERMSEKIDQGFSILTFPEGTRTRDGAIRPFKSGTFRLALQKQVDILPMAMVGSYEGMKAETWVMQPRPIFIQIGKPISICDFSNDEDGVHRLKDYCRERIIELKRQAQEMEKEWRQKRSPDQKTCAPDPTHEGKGIAGEPG